MAASRPRSQRPHPASISHKAQALALGGAVRLLHWAGPVASSNAGGWLARTIGPRLRVSRIADQNLRLALPGLDAPARRRIIRAVWDNLGRNAAELPHLATFRRSDSGPGWELTGAEHVPPAGSQALFFSGHFGNWEMVLPIAAQLGIPVSGFYRAASNRQVDSIIQALRQNALGPDVAMFAKGSQGARSALLHLSRGGSLGLLVDQKMNDGISIPFFGIPAMTAPALAQFALRFKAPVIPVHVLRLGPARFRMICEAPLAISVTGDKQADIHALTLAMNAALERWITNDPASWLWLHRRWPKDAPSRMAAGQSSGAVSG